ncbi:MAG: hypothetical protein US59_C0043G0005 [Candidatus Levybacteria bacterium GW2011_GWB1_37_8]|nr:MAG: hypothetical protein US59_C0043G0005 [Candidatus Levybacteria bacterium GW2011_GWB1_37_8]
MRAKELGIWVGVIAILIGGLWFLIASVNNSPSPSAPAQIKIPEVSNQDFIKSPQLASGSARLPSPEGEANGRQARVTLVEYADFQCPACKAYFPLVTKLSSDIKDLRIVYRFFPLSNIHKNAMISSQAAYAAGLQGKFWEMHDMIFENQDSWSNTQARDIFIDYAKKLNLDSNKFESDMTSDATRKFITQEMNKAISLGINSTPTFFVNGKHIQNPAGYEAFKKIIQDELAN